MERTLTSIVNTEALEFAIYSVENRAIPHLIDGFKPVQRFFLYSALKSAMTSFDKVAAIGSAVSRYGYHHGETSAQDAGKLMAGEWCNNICLIEGEGNFGSTMNRESSAARYVYARVHPNFEKYFPDSKLAPAHKDKEHIPPAYYLPIIPMVLVNGVKGIATGFAANIMPHCPLWVNDAVLEYLTTGDIVKHKEPVIKFPDFAGTIEKTAPNKYEQVGAYSVKGLSVNITEVPTSYEHDKYISLLDKLQSDGKIVSYVDKSSERYNIDVKLKRGSKTTPAFIEKLLGLRVSKPFNQNLNVIAQNGKIRSYTSVIEIIKDFVDHRKTFYPTRIDTNKASAYKLAKLCEDKVMFIRKVIDGSIELSGQTRKQAADYLETFGFAKENIDILLKMQFDKLTLDEIDKLEKEQNAATKEYDYWCKATPLSEYKKDLRGIK